MSFGCVGNPAKRRIPGCIITYSITAPYLIFITFYFVYVPFMEGNLSPSRELSLI